MSTPIKSSNTAGSAVNGAGMSPALNELMNKLSAQASQGAADADSPEQQFSRWLEKHGSGAEGARRPEPQHASANANANAAAKSLALQNNVAASRAAEQALARARQMATQAAKPAQAQGTDPNAHASAKPAAKGGTDQNSTAKAGRKEAAAKPAQGDPNAVEETSQEAKDVNFNTAMGEGSAVVRELTPPPTIQSGDSAGMMAWLASLTAGDPNAQGLPASELAAGDEAGASSDADTAVLDLSPKGKGVGRGHPGGMTLELQAWQGVSGKADAAMEQLGKGVGMGADPLAAGMMAGAGKASGFGQILGEAQNVRHESASLNTPFGSPEFPQALAEKVSMWVNTARDNGPMTAELHLNPAEMGPINVKISLDGQSAHVDFAAAALETRQAIESSLSMLSSALGDIGLSLTGGDVSSQTSQQAFEQASRQGGTASARGTGKGEGGESDEGEGLGMKQVSAPRPGRAGGLDLYA